jgi:hypothetical protein
MEIHTAHNSASIQLNPGEAFYVKPSLLQGFGTYDWAFPPPHPLGSPFLRLYHGAWLLKEVLAEGESLNFEVFGDRPRGNFLSLTLTEGEKLCVATRCLAGFSGELPSIHTRIRFSLAYWLLHEHFFSVAEGPGTILLYSPSPLQATGSTEFQPERIIAFNARKKFRPLSPQPRRAFSQLINMFFSHEVIWQFQEAGDVWAETCTEWAERPPNGFVRFFKHLIGFLRI